MNHHPENKQEQRFHNKQTESNHISSDTVPQIFLPKQSSFISSSINQSPQYTNTQQYDSQFSFHQIPPPPSVPNSEIVDVLQRLKYAILDSKSFFFPSDNLIDGDDDEIQSSSHQPNTYKPNPINANLIDKARIPVLKLTHNPTQLHADISYGVVSGVVNTDFVRGLLAVYRYARPIIMVVKQLLQYHHLNEPYKGGMSGYPLTLLVVSHLQQFRRNFGLEWKYASLGRLLTTFFQLYGESPDLPDPQTFALSSKSQLSQKESDRRAEFARIVPYSPSSPQLSQKESNLHKVSSNTNILRKSSSVEAFSPFVPQMQNIGMSFTGIETKQVGDKQFQPTQHLEKFSFQKFAISVRADGQYIPISQLLYTNRKLVLANDVSSNKSTMEGIGTGPNYMRRNSSNEIGMKYNAQMITDFMQNNAPQHAQLGSGAEFNAVHGVQNLFGMTNLMQMQQMNGVGQQIGVGIPMNMNMDNVGGMNEQQMQQIQQMQQLGNLQGMQFGYAQQSALNQMQLQNQFQIQQQQAYMPMNFPVNQSFPMMMSQQQKGNGIVAALTLAPTPTINIGAPSQIVVEDPLDYENNAARSCFAIKNIKTLFLQAYQSLTQDERENTQETSKDQSNTKDVQNNSDRNQLNNKENTTQRKNNHIFPPDLKIIEKCTHWEMRQIILEVIKQKYRD
ncbi:MAG: hypothetical protein EZS28_008469 [Streblomastix strix]|uniref:PAP-associated domain-containing protein n=1 Tax=Streblomastix strix TaxID=222440 RepID=A0A5J4WP72_9EUKA|nr:MAG: hypothetical protein EZS28_008469 [Streblomastix strix]